MGEVALGLPGPWAEDYREKADHYTTKIGGVPDWPSGYTGIRPDLLLCGLCGGKLCLVAQVYAPISMPKFNFEERVIYVFGCLGAGCGSKPQSWRALRVQKCNNEMIIGGNNSKAVPQEDNPPVTEIGSSCEGTLSMSYCKSSNESDSDTDLQGLAQALAEAATLASLSKNRDGSKRSNATRLKGAVVKQIANDASLPALPSFYVYFEKEHSAANNSVRSCGGSSIDDIQSKTASDHEKEEWGGEAYEYGRALGADRTYLKFKKQLDASPQQCLRYSYGGKPLLATENLPKPDNCKLCGSSRQYELQLMAPLLYFLHQAADSSSACPLEGWAWMALIINTCSKSCCPSACGDGSSACRWGAAEEEIAVQDD